MKLRLDLRLAQKLIMTPQLQQAIKLLQLSRLELSQVITQELVENPLLEEESQDQEEESQDQNEEETNPDSSDPESAEEAVDENKEELSPDELQSQWEDYLDDDFDRGNTANTVDHTVGEGPSFEQTLSKKTTLMEHLVSQFLLVRTTDKEREIGLSVIGNIDENGYLRTSIEEISSAVEAPVETVEKMLKTIQSLDPMGVGARDLVECLLIQIREQEIKNGLIEKIIQGHLNEIEVKKYKAVAKLLNVSLQEVVDAVKVIEGLEPKPGRPFFTNDAQTIIPDIYVVKSEGQYQVGLNDDGMPRLHVSPFYRKLLTSKVIASSSTKQYLNDHLKSAIWLIRSIEQRNRTIFKVASSIVKLQKDFFDRGIAHLKPLVLRQVAEDISMHESTISRVTTNKYMHTHQGIFELKFFFTNSVSLSSEHENGMSSVTVREAIRKIVEEEGSDLPLKDQEIVEQLRAKDIHIARRTVAKYRNELKIPPANRRKIFS